MAASRMSSAGLAAHVAVLAVALSIGAHAMRSDVSLRLASVGSQRPPMPQPPEDTDARTASPVQEKVEPLRPVAGHNPSQAVLTIVATAVRRLASRGRAKGEPELGGRIRRNGGDLSPLAAREQAKITSLLIEIASPGSRRQERGIAIGELYSHCVELARLEGTTQTQFWDSVAGALADMFGRGDILATWSHVMDEDLHAFWGEMAEEAVRAMGEDWDSSHSDDGDGAGLTWPMRGGAATWDEGGWGHGEEAGGMEPGSPRKDPVQDAEIAAKAFGGGEASDGASSAEETGEPDVELDAELGVSSDGAGEAAGPAPQAAPGPPPTASLSSVTFSSLETPDLRAGAAGIFMLITDSMSEAAFAEMIGLLEALDEAAIRSIPEDLQDFMPLDDCETVRRGLVALIAGRAAMQSPTQLAKFGTACERFVERRRFSARLRRYLFGRVVDGLLSEALASWPQPRIQAAEALVRMVKHLPYDRKEKRWWVRQIVKVKAHRRASGDLSDTEKAVLGQLVREMKKKIRDGNRDRDKSHG